MSEKGKYLYGIINSNTDESFGPCGIENKVASSSLHLNEVGESLRAGEEVYFIPYKDISAIVSNEEIVNYTHMLKDALARLLVRHQKIIEKIMSLGYTIIPMRLETFAADETDVKEILKKGYTLIKNIFKKISDKIEVDVVSTWSDFDSVLKEAGEEKEVKEFKERLLANSKGITVDDQMKLGIILKKALDNKRGKYAFKIQSALKNDSHDFKIHELMDDKMVINSAFLINKSRQKEFYRKIESLNNEFEEKLNFRCVGPLPPYSFYTLEIERIQLNDVNWARKKLRILDDITSKHEIKKAYQRLAFSYHPDKNPDTPGIEKEFNEINKAYKLLINYCEACEQAGKTESCSFKEKEFKKNAVLVKVKE